MAHDLKPAARLPPGSYPSPLARRLLLAVLPLAVLGVVMSSLTLYRAARGPILAGAQREVDALAQRVSQDVHAALEARRSDLDAAAEIPPLQHYIRNREYGLLEEAESYRRELASYFRAVRRRTAAYRAIVFVDLAGVPVAASGDLGTARRAHVDAVRRLGKGARYLSDVESDASAAVLGRPIRDTDGELRGVLLMAMDLAPLSGMLGRSRGGSRGSASLVDGRGRRLLGDIAVPGPSLTASRAVPGAPWLVRIEAASEDFLAPVSRIQRLTLWLCLLGGSLMAALVLAQVRGVTAPIGNLVVAARRLAAGDFSHRVVPGGSAETAVLAESFNAMAAALQGRTQDLRLSEERYRTVVDGSLDAIIGLDSELRVILWNRGAERLFGYSAAEMAGTVLQRVLEPGEVGRLAARLAAEGVLANAEAKAVARGGRSLDLSLAWAPRGEAAGGREWALVARDVTADKAIRAQLVQAEKLALTGQLLSGIAHELNNPLTNVVGYAEILLDPAHASAHPPDLRQDLEQIAANARRSSEIVSNLLLFVRKSRGCREPVAVRRVLEESLLLLEHGIKKSARVELECGMEAGLPPVWGSPQEIQQVLINIIQNACQAMKNAPAPRRLGVAARRDAGEVVLEILDSGPGVAPRDRERIFEPFYTTRADGTGLGLAICRQIVSDHGGSIVCEASRWGGALIRLRLPVADPSERRAGAPLPPPAPGRRVLVVDDEPGVLDLMRRVLEADGQRVEAARSASEGLAALEGRAFDLLIVDLHLGDGDGNDLLDRARRLPAPPRVLLVTGDVSRFGAVVEDRGEAQVLAKPFTPKCLRDAVRRILASVKTDPAEPAAGRHPGPSPPINRPEPA